MTTTRSHEPTGPAATSRTYPEIRQLGLRAAKAHGRRLVVFLL